VVATEATKHVKKDSRSVYLIFDQSFNLPASGQLLEGSKQSDKRWCIRLWGRRS